MLPRTFTIIQDMSPSNPREDMDNLGTLTGTAGRFHFADKGHGGNGWTMADTLAHIATECGADVDPDTIDAESLAPFAVILPVYRFDHSAVAYSVRPFGCRWDSGQVGYIFASLPKIAAEYGDTSPETLDKVREVLAGEVSTFSAYANGDVYGVRIFDEVEELDACWGFYGSDHEASGLMEYVRQYIPDAKA